MCPNVKRHSIGRFGGTLRTRPDGRGLLDKLGAEEDCKALGQKPRGRHGGTFQAVATREASRVSDPTGYESGMADSKNRNWNSYLSAAHLAFGSS